MSKLSEIQQKLKAPKGQKNNFGNYNYRSCEDILEAVKPLLGDSTLTLSDEVVEVGGRVYIKATAKLWSVDENVEVTAYAREAEDKKGMDAAQITGSSSSYARKHALNGLFCIDDTKDADSTNTHGKGPNDYDPKAAKSRLITEIDKTRTDENRAQMDTRAWSKNAVYAVLGKQQIESEADVKAFRKALKGGKLDLDTGHLVK